MTSRTVIVAANPYSGSRRNQDRVAALMAALEHAGLQTRPMWQPHELADAAEQPGFADEFRCVVAAGGDGTLNHVINQQTVIPLAMFPLGNENLFAREFNLPHDPEAAAQMILAGRTRTIDLGQAGTRRFCCIASAGFDADVAHRLAAWRPHVGGLKRVTRMSYVQRLAASVWNYQYPMMQIEADDRRLSGSMVMVFNTSPYAFGLRPAGLAVPDDGLFDWVVYQRPHRWPLTVYTLATLLGQQLKLSDVQHGRSKRITLACDSPVPFEIDGDPSGFAPVEINVLPQALKIVVPEEKG